MRKLLYWSTLARSARRWVARAAVLAVVAAPMSAKAADTVQDFSANFPAEAAPTPLTLGRNLPEAAQLVNGSITGDPSVRYLQLTADNVNSQSGNAGFGFISAMSGPYDSMKVEFDFRMNDPGAGADGFGLAWVPTATYGLSGLNPQGFHEEPNLAGSLGIGFDTWNNDDGTDGTDTGLSPGDGSQPDSMSLHFNGARLVSRSLQNPVAWSTPYPGDAVARPWLENGNTKHAEITLTPSGADMNVFVKVTEPSSGQIITPFGAGGTLVTGMSTYNGRLALSGRTGGENQEQSMDNFTAVFDPAGAGGPTNILINNFDTDNPPPPPPPTALGGTPYWPQNHNLSQPDGVIVPTFPLPPAGGDADGQYRLTDNVTNQQNSIAFERTLDTMEAGGRLQVGFDIQVRDLNVSTADGMALMLLNTNTWGETGPLPQAIGFVMEDPNLPGAVGLGFDTFDNNEDGPAGDPNGCFPGDVCVGGERRANSVSAHVNGGQIAQEFIPTDLVEYEDGNWIHVDVAIDLLDDGMGGLAGFMDLTLTDLVTGGTFQPFAGLGLSSVPADMRLAFGARTGGENDFQYLDNVYATYTPPVPEPATFVLLGIGAAGLLVLGRRRK